MKIFSDTKNKHNNGDNFDKNIQFEDSKLGVSPITNISLLTCIMSIKTSVPS